MHASTEAILLRVFVGEEHVCDGRLVWEAIVETALERHMAGATVFQGSDGFGHARRGRSELYVDVGPHLPMVVEIIDTQARIDQFLPILDDMIESGLITLERIRAIQYPPRDGTEAGAATPAPGAA